MDQSWMNTTVSATDELEALGHPMQAFLVSLYSFTALLALSGNIIVIAVLLRGRRSSRELRVFLINLAVSDVAMAIFSIPFTYTDFMLGRWIFEPGFCPIVQFMQHCSVIVSVYTMTAVGIDRYYAIMYPLNARWTKSRGPLILIGIWLIAFGISSAQLVHGKAKKFKYKGQEYYDCTEEWNEFDGKVYTAVIFSLTFVLPMLVLVFAYSSIGWRLWRHASPGNEDVSRDHQQLMAKLKVVKMLVTIVLMFALCWLPTHIFSMLVYFNPSFTMASSDVEYYGFVAAFFITHWLSMSNSFINPLVYCFMSDTFRMDLRQICCGLVKTSKKSKNLMLQCSTYGSSFRTTTHSVVNHSNPDSFRINNHSSTIVALKTIPVCNRVNCQCNYPEDL